MLESNILVLHENNIAFNAKLFYNKCFISSCQINLNSVIFSSASA